MNAYDAVPYLSQPFRIYSWVPGDVQDEIMATCGEQLAAGGVAYVSYNCYPGWHLLAV